MRTCVCCNESHALAACSQTHHCSEPKAGLECGASHLCTCEASPIGRLSAHIQRLTKAIAWNLDPRLSTSLQSFMVALALASHTSHHRRSLGSICDPMRQPEPPPFLIIYRCPFFYFLFQSSVSSLTAAMTPNPRHRPHDLVTLC